MNNNDASTSKRSKSSTFLQSGQDTINSLYGELTDAAASVCAMLFPELSQTALQPVPITVEREERHVWIGL
jgi:hypothetical protein